MGEITTHSKPSQLGLAGLTQGSIRTGTISGLTISVITVRDARLMRPLVVFLRLMRRISRSSWKILRITRKIWDNMGNLSCVMTKMEMLDSSLQVNLAMYTGGFWEKMDLSKTLAGSDPVWRQMMTSGYTDCYSIAQTLPEEALEKNPVTKVFGRHMIFFKCAAKVEKKCCYQAQMHDWIKTMYGDDPSFNWAQY